MLLEFVIVQLTVNELLVKSVTLLVIGAVIGAAMKYEISNTYELQICDHTTQNNCMDKNITSYIIANTLSTLDDHDVQYTSTFDNT